MVQRQTKKRPRLPGGFTLGGEQAEADPLLNEAFFNTGDCEVIQSFDDTRCFLIGRTGSGKTAALKQLELRNPSNVIRINPEDLSLPYITDLQVFRFLDGLDVLLDPLWIALWKHVLLVEVLKKRYKVTSRAAKQNFLEALKEKVKRDPAKAAALAYLEEFEGRFWCETDERVRETIDGFTKKIGAEAGVGSTGPSNIKLSGQATGEFSSSTRREQAGRYQKIVNDTQLARLNKMFTVLNEDVLDEDQHRYFIVIDDLDRDWIDERLSNDLIRCLFRSVLDMKRVRNVKVLVALRSNIFEELDFGNRGGGQEEKFRSLVLQMRWNEHDLRGMLDARVRVAAHLKGIELAASGDLLPNVNRKRGDPMEFILDRTLLRPRDAIAFFNECLSRAAGKTRLSWEDIHVAEHAYSANRLLALRDEWKQTYPGIDLALASFRGGGFKLTRAEFTLALDNIMLLVASHNFSGTVWLTWMSEAIWSPGPERTWFECYQPLTSMLYRIGFIGCARGGSPPVFFESNPRYCEAESLLSATESFYVHRAYQPALDLVPQTNTR